VAHLDIARHFGERLVRRGSGGLMFVGAMGADKGIPFMANEAGAKVYVRSLSLSLHEEFKSHGIHVTVLPPAVGAVTANSALAVKIAGIAWNVSHDIHASIVADTASVGVTVPAATRPTCSSSASVQPRRRRRTREWTLATADWRCSGAPFVACSDESMEPSDGLDYGRLRGAVVGQLQTLARTPSESLERLVRPR